MLYVSYRSNIQLVMRQCVEIVKIAQILEKIAISIGVKAIDIREHLKLVGGALNGQCHSYETAARVYSQSAVLVG
jgi:hypothetical protein